MRPSKREDIIEQALLVFEKRGFRGVGVDGLAKACGVSKTSIYNNFGSKEGLTLAVLRHREVTFESWIIGRVEARADRFEDQLLALFDALGEWFEVDGTSGAAALLALAEHPGPGHPIRQQACAEKRSLLAHITVLTRQAGFAAPDMVAGQIAILFEGAIAAAAAGVVADPATRAREAAAAVMKTARRSPGWIKLRAGVAKPAAARRNPG